MRIDGGCHCGFITFEAETDSANAALCHCSDCQNISGSAFRANVRVARKTLRFKGGEPTRYLKTTSESGTPRIHAFCPKCGSPLYATSTEDKPASYSLRLGTIRQRDQFRPSQQIWMQSALPWVTDIAAVPKHDKGA
jgi:hypothetical protein